MASRHALIRAEQVRIARCRERLTALSDRSRRAVTLSRERKAEHVAALHALLGSLGYKAVLARGYAVVRDGEGRPVRSAAAVNPGQALAIEFGDGIVKASADGTAKADAAKPKRKPAAMQRSLFEG